MTTSNETTERDLYDAVARLIKARGRFHTEQNYAALVKAFDACRPAAASPPIQVTPSEPMAYIVNMHDGRRIGFCDTKQEANDTAATYGNASKIIPLYAAPVPQVAPEQASVRNAAIREALEECEGVRESGCESKQGAIECIDAIRALISKEAT